MVYLVLQQQHIHFCDQGCSWWRGAATFPKCHGVSGRFWTPCSAKTQQCHRTTPQPWGFCLQGDTCDILEPSLWSSQENLQTFTPHHWWAGIYCSPCSPNCHTSPHQNKQRLKAPRPQKFHTSLTSLHSRQPRIKLLGLLYSGNWASDVIPNFWVLRLERTYCQILSLN